jgi:CBS domain-containing protein
MEAVPVTQAHVGDVMTTTVVSTEPTATYQQLVRLLATHGISGVPVIDSLGRVVGVVSETDLIDRLDTVPRRWWRRRRGSKRGLTARELMTSPPVTAMATTPLAEAVRRMRDADVTRLPVVSELGVLVGIVSRADLLRIFMRDDDVVAAEVTEVLRRVFLLDPLCVKVQVHEGVVTLRGELAGAEVIELVTAWVADLDGVVDVHSLLHTPAPAGHAR